MGLRWLIEEIRALEELIKRASKNPWLTLLYTVIIVVIALGFYYRSEILEWLPGEPIPVRTARATLRNAGLALEAEGPGAALVHYRNARTMAESLKKSHRVLLAQALVGEADCLRLKRQPLNPRETAPRQLYLLALEELKRLDATDDEVKKWRAYTLLGLADLDYLDAARSQGVMREEKITEATHGFEAALDMFKAIGDELGKSRVHLGRTAMYLTLGLPEQAKGELRYIADCELGLPSIEQRESFIALTPRDQAHFFRSCAHSEVLLLDPDEPSEEAIARAMAHYREAIHTLGEEPKERVAMWQIDFASFLVESPAMCKSACSITSDFVTISPEHDARYYLRQKLAESRAHECSSEFTKAVDTASEALNTAERHNLEGEQEYVQLQLYLAWFYTLRAELDSAESAAPDLQKAGRLLCDIRPRAQGDGAFEAQLRKDLEPVTEQYRDACRKRDEEPVPCG
ncbi:MAG: hypothetical protein JSU86_18540 [Phycisphaerales bacterium]|nr:MAG: hypothetical protein JSU86_18540 [Phycisphaerales bacterium]